VVVDSRNVLNGKSIQGLGLRYVGNGRPGGF